MELPHFQTSVSPEVTWTLSDTALFAEGARFRGGHFVITDEQYHTLQGESGQAAPEVPFEIAVAAKPLTIARSGFKKIYFSDRVDAVAPQLLSEDPETYIEGVREYVRSVNAAPTSTGTYRYLRAVPPELAPPRAATLIFKPEVTNQNLPREATPVMVNNLAKQLDRFFTISDMIAELATESKGLSLYEKPGEFQKAVRRIFLDQHIKLLEFAIAAGCFEAHIKLASETNTLFCNDISQLEAAQKQYPEISSSQLIITFMRHSIKFEALAARAQAALERRNALRAATSSEQCDPHKQKWAIDMESWAAQLRENQSLWQTLPQQGATISLPSPAEMPNALFCGIATLDKHISREFGKSTWEAWLHLPEQNPAHCLADSLATVPGTKRALLVALPTTRALREFTQKLPDRPSVNPEHALRFNLICTVDTAGHRTHFLMDIMYFTVDGETPGARRHRVVASNLLTDKQALSRHLQKLQALDGRTMALVVQKALNGK